MTAITKELLQAVVAIARDAGLAIMQIYNSGDSARLADKSDSSPLTLADLAAHRVIVAGLNALTPDVLVVSEEDEASHAARKAVGEFWLLDPLDGTKEFIARSGDFTVNIALIQNGKAVLGVVDAPAQTTTYWGAQGLGAFKSQGEQAASAISVQAQPPAAAPLRIVASKSHLNQETLDFIAQFGAHELVQAGSSLKLCRVAEGSADIYPRLGLTCEWDTAAAQAVVEAAGGVVTQMDGQPLTYGKPDKLNPHFIVSARPWQQLLAERL